ncbi:hypothetical protein N180_01225 [Pedobacter antarcticus 4BY]|uniref:FtsK domain-containing protein n=2 Tax=Pedobacter antarcticus TaxID=34086 RepID=A0A081PC61_9SPHI|nr:DNA translocase FtsK [Pedobacter antarcticus]KEQ28284.1 hypothetical protein N180_01225 [Pedobacter antarcticus 4BY]SFE47692.1 FtsK/SpoIIIE family protein [Pedobacter antarcticus]
MEEQNIQSNISDSVYNSVENLSDYEYPEVSLVSETFRAALINSINKRQNCQFPLVLGCDSEIRIEDIFNRPNVLIAGITGSGKTQFIYTQIAFWLFHKHPSQLKLILCGSKSIDYTSFNTLDRHFMAAPYTGTGIIHASEFHHTIISLINEVEERIRLFTLAGVKTINQYNSLFIEQKLDPKQRHHFLPDITVIIDDISTFIFSESNTALLIALTQMNIHTGIYIIAATSQINIPAFSTQLRSNFVLRVAFKLMSQRDSRKILDSPGAERLNDPGELIYDFSGQLIKTNVPLIEYSELQKLIVRIAEQKGYSESYKLYNPNPKAKIKLERLDSMIKEAARLIVIQQQGSTSLIQRKLKLGYNRAGRIIDQLEEIGVIGPFEGSHAREVNIPDLSALECFFENLEE